MRLVIDTNIVFSALLKESTTRKLIFSPKMQLFSVKEIFEEIAKYKSLIIQRAKIEEEAYNKLFDEIADQITLIPHSVVTRCSEEANSLISHRDKKDVPFLSLALCLETDGLWSNDPDFDEQDKIRRFTTTEIYKLVLE